MSGSARDRSRLALLVASGYLRGQVRWALRREVRTRAARDAKVLLRGTAREGQARRVGRRIVGEQAVQWAVFPHYPLLATAPFRGVEHLDEAEALGRGVMLVTTHCGPIQALLWCLTRAGRPFTCVSGQWLVRSERPTDLRQMPMVRDAIDHGAHHLIAGSGAFEGLEKALAEHGRTLMAIDMPGSLELTYLGKPARLGQGTYRVAWNAGAPIVPLGIRRRGLGFAVEAHPMVLPGDHEDVAAFAQAVTDALSAASLADAEQYTPRNVAILWPGGDASRSRPNRVAWAASDESKT